MRRFNLTGALAAALSLENLFRGDYQEGTLELMVVSDAPLVLIGLGKSFAHWLFSGLPITATEAAARGLVNRAVPRGQVLDEPFTALDLHTRHVVEELLEEHLERGGIALIVTHQAFDLRREVTELTLGGPPQ